MEVWEFASLTAVPSQLRKLSLSTSDQAMKRGAAGTLRNGEKLMTQEERGLRDSEDRASHKCFTRIWKFPRTMIKVKNNDVIPSSL